VILLPATIILAAVFMMPDDVATPRTGKLTVTIENMFLYTDVEYHLLIDGEDVEFDTILAGYVKTFTYDVTWSELSSLASHTMWPSIRFGSSYM